MELFLLASCAYCRCFRLRLPKVIHPQIENYVKSIGEAKLVLNLSLSSRSINLRLLLFPLFTFRLFALDVILRSFSGCLYAFRIELRLRCSARNVNNFWISVILNNKNSVDGIP